MRAFRRPITRLAAAVAAIASVTLLLAGCAGIDPDGRGAPGAFPPPSATDQGEGVNGIYPLVFWIAVGVFVLVEGLIVFAMLRYRRKPADVDLPAQTHGNNLLEVLWTVIPAAVVAVLFVLTIVGLNRVDARPPNDQYAVVVDVDGFQWQWTFRYEEQGIEFTGLGEQGPEMVLPVNEPVLIRLHSNNVLHSFYVPRFLYKKDVVPGRVNEFPVTLTQPGEVYGGQCAEYCGLSHNSMYFTVRAATRADFDAWVAAEQEKARATPTPAPSGQPSGPPGSQVQISASNNVKFDQDVVQVPANTPITVTFVNNDPAAQHNVAIPALGFAGQPLAKPGETVTYTTPPLPAGDNEFICSVHPNMKATLKAQ
ncbi:MAG: cytochrome c oxidase subunit II [Chloroflexi bacterium]|nr:cytochrome c oxidase subunit II [Chloroflexota bacterium]